MLLMIICTDVPFVWTMSDYRTPTTGIKTGTTHANIRRQITNTLLLTDITRYMLTNLQEACLQG